MSGRKPALFSGAACGENASERVAALRIEIALDFD
jgi:hypothetical protein